MPYPLGIDFEWYATDGEQRVARFTTAGLGPIPKSVLERADLCGPTGARFGLLPRRGGARLTVAMPKPDDFVAISEAGLFAYDYTNGNYELVSIPSAPASVDDLPDDAKDAASLIQFREVRFGSEGRLSPMLFASFVLPGS